MWILWIIITFQADLFFFFIIIRFFHILREEIGSFHKKKLGLREATYTFQTEFLFFLYFFQIGVVLVDFFFDISLREEIGSLHNMVGGCVDILGAFEKLLTTFQADLSNISDDIKNMQDQSMEKNIKINNRKVCKKSHQKHARSIYLYKKYIL